MPETFLVEKVSHGPEMFRVHRLEVEKSIRRYYTSDLMDETELRSQLQDNGVAASEADVLIDQARQRFGLEQTAT